MSREEEGRERVVGKPGKEKERVGGCGRRMRLVRAFLECAREDGGDGTACDNWVQQPGLERW